MTESINPDAQSEKIIIEVPSHSVEELREILGDFVLKHGGLVSEKKDAKPSKPEMYGFAKEEVLVNDNDLSPNYVLWDIDLDGNTFTLVSQAMLKTFGHESGFIKPDATDRISHPFFIPYSALPPYHESNAERLAYEGHLVTGVNHGVGLDARKIPELVKKLRIGD